MNTKAKEVKAIELDISNLSKDQAMTALIGQHGKTFKEAEAYWKENGTQIRGGVFQATLDYLAEAPRTQSDLAAYVIKSGTKNEARWFGQRDAIRRLSISVRGDKSFTEVAATATQNEALKAIVEG
jgi:hypothetical protein